MTLTKPENTLLGLIKLYFGKADTDLSDEGIKSLVKLTQFKTLLLRIAQVTPDSIENLIMNLMEILHAHKERREAEKNKKALEPKPAEYQDSRAVKRLKLATSVADKAAIIESGRGTRKTPAEEANDTARQSTDTSKKENQIVHDVGRSGASTSSDTSCGSPYHSPEAVTDTGRSGTATSSDTSCGSPYHSSEAVTDTLSPSSVISRPTTIPSIRSTVSPSPSMNWTTSYLDTTKESASDPTFRDDASASRSAVLGTPSTVLHESPTQAETQTQQPPSQPFNHSNTSKNEQLLLANAALELADESPEIAIVTQDKDMMQQLRHHFEEEVYPTFSRGTKATKIGKDITAVLELGPMLNFDYVKDHLLAFIVQRRQAPATRAQIIDLEEDAEPVAIFQAIIVSEVDEADAKLQRIYGQIKLVKSIDRRVEQGYIPRMYASMDDLPHTLLPLFYLDDMAYEMTKGQPEDAQRKLERQLRRERQAGLKWLNLIEDLGGMGIVFVFVFAGKCTPLYTQRELRFTVASRDQSYQACQRLQRLSMRVFKIPCRQAPQHPSTR